MMQQLPTAPTTPTPLELAARPPARLLGWVALLLVGPLVLLVLRLWPSLDGLMLHSATAHVAIAGGVAGLGAILALLVLRTARRAQDGRVFLVGMGFLSVATIFFIHAIATPNVLMSGRSFATSWSGFFSLVVGGVFFAASGLNLSTEFSRRITGSASRWLAVYAFVWAVYCSIMLVWLPSTDVAASPSAPAAMVDEYQATQHHGLSEAPAGLSLDTLQQLSAITLLTVGLIGAGLVCYAFAAVRHYGFYRAAPSSAGLAITCGTVLLGEALLTQPLSSLYTLSFWLYHLEEFAGFCVISYGVLVAYTRTGRGEGALESLFLSGTRARMQARYTTAMDSLIATLSRSEQPSPALRQVLRERFGLSETQLRVLEQAAAAIAQERQQRQKLEQLNAELRQLEQDRDQLSQMIVHDLKNPLTAMIGFLDLMRLRPLSAEQTDLLQSALRSGRNLAGLIGDLLDIGQLEDGQLELKRQIVSAHDLFRETAEQMQAWLEHDQKTIQIDLPPDLPALLADQRLMRRVMLNLVSNAIKHTPSGTQIVLSARAEPSGGEGELASWFVICVADNGSGIPPEVLPHIFEKYRRDSRPEQQRQSSTGLGLTFCRLAVGAHGGQITATSEPGSGATFTVRLPQPPTPHHSGA